MSAATRVLAMLLGVALIQALWLANKYVVENYWKPAVEDETDEEDRENGDETAAP